MIPFFGNFVELIYLVTNMETRSGEMVSAQVARFGDIDISALQNDNFKLADGNAFLIKNEGSDKVTLEVIPAASKEDVFVACVFDVGWNPELVREIKSTSLSNVVLKFGL